LSDFFAIDFLTTDWYEKNFPLVWKSQIPFNAKDICNVVRDGAIQAAWPESLKEYVSKVHSLGLNRHVQDYYCLHNIKLEKDIMIGMNTKKVKETSQLSKLIHDICTKNNVTHILDLGCGQGYLSTVLAFQFKYNVFGWDADPHQTSGAIQRAKRIAHLLKLRGHDIPDGYLCMRFHSFFSCLEFMTERIEWDDMNSIFTKLFLVYPEAKGLI
jgi:2-polyprenyl-3-methyl-5-hydroxy-6-metoxy-1,4-benzoquinol methylase